MYQSLVRVIQSDRSEKNSINTVVLITEQTVRVTGTFFHYNNALKSKLLWFSLARNDEELSTNSWF